MIVQTPKSEYFSDTFINRIWPLFSSTLIKPDTKNSYLLAVKKICDYLKKDFLEINADEAQEYFNMYSHGGFTKKDGTPYNVASIFIYYSQLKAIANYIIENHGTFQDIKYTSPFTFTKIKQPSVNVEVKNLLSLKEIGQILSFVKGTPLFLILSFACRMGLSNRDIIQLRPQDVQKAKNDRFILSIRSSIPGKAPKRHLAIPEDLDSDLQEYWQRIPLQCKTLFYNTRLNPLTAKTLEIMIKRETEKAGFKGVTMQKLRTSAGFHMYQNGAKPSSVAIQLGINERWVYRYNGDFSEFENQASQKIQVEYIPKGTAAEHTKETQ